MRKLSIILGAGLLMAACAFAAPQEATISVATGTNTAGTATLATVSGYVDEIVFKLPTGGSPTGTVTLAVTQPSGNTITLATKGIAATTLFRPRLDGTDTAGVALTSDPPGRYLSYGDTWTLTVAAASVTGKTWQAWIKYDDWK
jgi:hypothetical protein